MTTVDRDALVAACLAAPADDAPRLVLADYLEETEALTAAEAAVLRDDGPYFAWRVTPLHRKLIWGPWYVKSVTVCCPAPAPVCCAVCGARTFLVLDRNTAIWSCVNHVHYLGEFRMSAKSGVAFPAANR